MVMKSDGPTLKSKKVSFSSSICHVPVASVAQSAAMAHWFDKYVATHTLTLSFGVVEGLNASQRFRLN